MADVNFEKTHDKMSQRCKKYKIKKALMWMFER